MTIVLKHKPSGIPWLSEVPANWEMKKIRFLFRFQSGGTPSTTNEAYWEGTLPWVSAKDMKKMWISDTEDHISEHALTESAANTVPANSLLLLTRSGILQHTIPVCVNSRRMAINQDVKGCIPVADNVDVRFCAYFIHGSQEQLLPLWRQEGATVESLEFETVKNTTFALPPLPEQRAIASFLDERTARIDGLIARKQRLVQLLKEKRQALITRAVTRGLDAKVKLKESGVPWLGKVPEHWEVKPLRHIGTFQNGISEGADYFGSGYPFVSYGDVYQGATLPLEVEGLANSTETDRLRYSVQQGDVLFTRTSETNEEIGFASTCMKTIENGTFSGFVIRMRPRKNMLVPDFSKHYFRSDVHRAFFVKEMNLVTRASLGQDLLKRLPVLLPPPREQEAIAEFIDDRTTRIDSLITKVEQAVLRLQEYRTALISAAVTGKVRVGGATPIP